jgi:hypothetical protein
MKRREFLAIPAGAAALAAAPAANSGIPGVPRARWIENGIIDAGGTNEPYLFRVRRGGQRLDERQRYERDQSEETIRGLKEAGVEVFHTHLYKGFGMAAEMPEMQDTVRAAAFAHSLRMRVDTYIQWNTLMYETFFAEEPRAKYWVQRDSLGRPLMIQYGFQQSFRYRPCFKNQNYLDYLKRVVQFAIQEAKTDFIHFDNFDLNPEPESCHCPWCVKGFRDRLRTKYTAEQRIERFGFANVDYVNPPEWNLSNPAGKLQVIVDPVIQEWIDFRCQLMADALHQIASYAKSLNPEVVIEVNPHGITGGNRPWDGSIDHARILPLTQAFWTEESNLPGVQSDGRLVSKIRSYKLARAFDNILFTYTDRDDLAAAECLAFNQTIGFAGNYPLSQSMRKYIDFYRRNRPLFDRTRDLADVAVLRSFASITYNQPRCQLSAILAEQALIEAAVPLHIIFDRHLENLSAYRVVVLPDSECLSDAQITAIRSFVEGGGGLAIIGDSGKYDQWHRERTTPGLAALVDGWPEVNSQEDGAGRHHEQNREARKQVGKGRVFYMSAFEFDGHLPEFGSYFRVDSRYWKSPANARQFLEGAAWAMNGEASVSIQGPRYLAANAVEQPGGRLTLIHLINYDFRGEAARDVEVTCRTPNNSRAASVHLYSPDYPDKLQAEAATRGNVTAFKVSQVNTYVIASVQWT